MDTCLHPTCPIILLVIQVQNVISSVDSFFFSKCYPVYRAYDEYYHLFIFCYAIVSELQTKTPVKTPCLCVYQSHDVPAILRKKKET